MIKYFTAICAIAAGVLTGLKLSGLINWGYAAVLAPLWMCVSFILLFYSGALTFAVIMMKRKERKTKRKYKQFLKNINEDEKN